jgi:Domain of unknown function (DUF5667)
VSIADEPPEIPRFEQRQPTRELLLAQALDACISAERELPGSSQEIIALQPAWARADLRRLVDLAGSLDAAASNAVMSPEFRAAARTRLMQRIGANGASVQSALQARLTTVPSRTGTDHAPQRRGIRWLWRSSAGLLAAALSVTATVTASASALPGEPLYSLKQVHEELSVRLAVDDQARALALLRLADARLDETTRLLRLGRTDAALETTLLYDEVVERATTTFVVTIEDAPAAAPITEHMETALSRQHDQLQALLQSAPEPAQADLREALVATERSRAMVADPRAVGRTSGRGRSAPAAAAPAPATEPAPTAEPAPTTVVQHEPGEDQPRLVPTRRPEQPPPTPARAGVLPERPADPSPGPQVGQSSEPDHSRVDEADTRREASAPQNAQNPEAGNAERTGSSVLARQQRQSVTNPGPGGDREREHDASVSAEVAKRESGEDHAADVGARQDNGPGQAGEREDARQTDEDRGAVAHSQTTRGAAPQGQAERSGPATPQGQPERGGPAAAARGEAERGGPAAPQGQVERSEQAAAQGQGNARGQGPNEARGRDNDDDGQPPPAVARQPQAPSPTPVASNAGRTGGGDGGGGAPSPGRTTPAPGVAQPAETNDRTGRAGGGATPTATSTPRPATAKPQATPTPSTRPAVTKPQATPTSARGGDTSKPAPTSTPTTRNRGS